MKKAVLFDMDGVLIDSFGAWFGLFNHTLKNFNKKEINKDEFTKKAWAQDVGKVAERYFKGIPIKEVVDFYFSNFMKFKAKIILSPNVKEILGLLKRKGKKIVLVSNTYHDLQRKMLKSVGLLEYFDLTFGADDVKKGKPAPDMVFLACKKLNIKPEDTILVGDTIWDKKTAEAAGCGFVGYKFKDGIKDLMEIKEMV
jgi:HAD superfamily hydrolase (TIGR01509 family)|tara:strand:- start:686 stop:1279 length:594 start_codon:yes stop_codon:yes gene_type:complete